MTGDGIRVARLARLSAEETAAVRGVIDAAADADGVSPLSEHVLLHLRYGGDAPVRSVLALVGDTVVGYAHLDVTDVVAGSSAELVVHPDYRGRGIAARLVDELVAESPDGRLRLWAHGEHPAAASLARSKGFEKARSLWQMRRSLLTPVPAPTLPDGVTIRTFRVGQDEQAWTEINNRAFAGHPEQGAWGVHEVELRERERWFDPAGFFIAERTGAMVGFHWTKVHGGDGHEHVASASDPAGHGHEPIGEVYVVGVDPALQGEGLGRALTIVGLNHLRARGLTQAMLYVDETNVAAIRVYESLEFVHWSTDVSYARTTR